MSADTFSLIVNTAIAMGTLGAVIVALVFGQKQRADVLNARYDSQRPLVLPLVMTPDLRQLTVRNMGLGVATNISGAVLAWASEGAGRDGMYHYVGHFDMVLPPGAEDTIAMKETRGSLQPATQVGTRKAKHPLLWPNESGSKYVWRLTLTYHDIFGRKHASIFDALMDSEEKRYEWHAHALIPGIEHDLDELERQKAGQP